MSRTKRKIQRATGGKYVGYSAAKSVVRAVHVAPFDHGQWIVRKAGKGRIKKTFSSKAAAMTFARQLEPSQKEGLVVHAKNGRVEVGKISKTGEFKVTSVKEPGLSVYGTRRDSLRKVGEQSKGTRR